MKKRNYIFTSKIGLYPGTHATWHYVGLPVAIGKKIRSDYKECSRGFGSLKVEVTTGKTTWRTSIFYDRSAKSYILFIKAAVRTAEELFAGEDMQVKLKILV